MWLKHFLCSLAFGHRKRYVAIVLKSGFSCSRITHSYHYMAIEEPTQVARWVCDRCGKMGEYCLGQEIKGTWTVSGGRLVPDEKRWANLKK